MNLFNFIRPILIFICCISTLGLQAQLADSLISLSKYTHLPNTSNINEIIVTEDNVKLIASSSGVFEVFSKNSPPNQLNSEASMSVCETRKNEIWTLQANQVLCITTGETIPLESGIQYNNLIYHRSSLWISSNEGLFRVNTKTLKVVDHFTNKNSKLKSNDVRFIFSDNQNNLWIGTKEGVAIIDTKDRWKIYEKESSMEAMAYNNEGLWLVSNQEMWLIDGFGRWYPAALDQGLKHGQVRDITTDQDGRLILASQSIVRYNPYIEEIHSYSAELGFLSQKASTIQGDKNQDIWIGTEGDGLYILSFSDTELAEISAIVEEENPIECNDLQSGKLTAKVFGGKPPYKYNWNQGEYKTKSIRGLSAGTYILNIADANNNVFITRYELKSNYPMTVLVNEIRGATGPDTGDGKADVTVEGGQTPYRYVWDNGENTKVASQLNAGVHLVTVQDETGCSANAEVTITKEKFIPQLDMNSITVGQTLQINELYFKADSSIVTETSYEVLDEVYEFLAKNPSVVIEIGGHTNNVPSKQYCYTLSTARAKNVADYLNERGISPSRISFKGYGKDFPIASNDSIAGRRKNQRVEIKILSVEG